MPYRPDAGLLTGKLPVCSFPADNSLKGRYRTGKV